MDISFLVNFTLFENKDCQIILTFTARCHMMSLKPKNFVQHCLVWILLIRYVRETLWDVYATSQESQLKGLSGVDGDGGFRFAFSFLVSGGRFPCCKYYTFILYLTQVTRHFCFVLFCFFVLFVRPNLVSAEIV